jgi:S-adenosylmethionine hydrolase
MKNRRRAALNPVAAFSHAPIVTLTTDFGTADYFVTAMKGAILSKNPIANIVDVTHEIPPHDIEAGAFILLTACVSFPPGTIHVAVVDPGVGSTRKPIVITAGEQFFVGPDNGLFSYVCDRLQPTGIFHLTNSEYFREPVSPTFNGRDIFAPVAAALSIGVAPSELGHEITDYVRLKNLEPGTTRNGQINGRVIHIDRFGNCVTNITRDDLSDDRIKAGATLRVKGKTIKTFRNYFSEKSDDREKVFGVWGSAGFLEIAAANQSAAKLLNAQRGDLVIVSLR